MPKAVVEAPEEGGPTSFAGVEHAATGLDEALPKVNAGLSIGDQG